MSFPEKQIDFRIIEDLLLLTCLRWTTWKTVSNQTFEKLLIFSFFSGQEIDKYYLPVIVPVGVAGNVLSFLVGDYWECMLNFLLFILNIKCRLIWILVDIAMVGPSWGKIWIFHILPFYCECIQLRPALDGCPRKFSDHIGLQCTKLSNFFSSSNYGTTGCVNVKAHYHLALPCII